jgi:hypothetical protein
MRYCLEVRAYTAVNINVTRVTRGVTNEQMRKRRDTDQLVEGIGACVRRARRSMVDVRLR